MRKFQSILFVTDHRTPSNSSLARAEEIAASSGASLTLVEVVRDGNEVADVFLDDRRRALEELRLSIVERGIEVEGRLLVGDPVVAIAGEVERGGHDLVMKSADIQAKESWPYNGTDFRLSRDCPAPVWIIKQSSHGRPIKILAALDPGAGEDPNVAGLDRQILDLAASIRALCDGEIHIVHAWSLSREILRQVSRGASDAGVSGTLENRARISLQRAVQGVVPAITADAVGAHIQVCEGEPVEVIADVARREEIDLIVMGTVARTGVAGLVVGNTAEKVLARVDCSLLTTKSEYGSRGALPAIEPGAESASRGSEQTGRE
jgi:nucleotide-binding universal stress UspA family protein